mmetsp:Transcript_81639/g.214301  ORF Transcript_81639/g.214301 Transcript_81639/m.214301 type:complete len:161 (-) Transcript_81639:113-595(-)
MGASCSRSQGDEMQFIGSGAGTYKAVTTLRYVGPGRGDFNEEVVTPPPVPEAQEKAGGYCSRVCTGNNFVTIVAGIVVALVLFGMLMIVIGPMLAAPEAKPAVAAASPHGQGSMLLADQRKYDCDDGTSPWTPEKKAYCCQVFGGCGAADGRRLREADAR